jgi:hypothetical protein
MNSEGKRSAELRIGDEGWTLWVKLVLEESSFSMNKPGTSQYPSCTEHQIWYTPNDTIASSREKGPTVGNIISAG